MTRYRMQQMVAVGPGTVVQLAAKQAARRTHRLEALGEDRYRTLDVMQFKVGEVVGFEEPLSKRLREQMERLEGESAEELPVLSAPPAHGDGPSRKSRR